jgi:hypothetical protein
MEVTNMTTTELNEREIIDYADNAGLIISALPTHTKCNRSGICDRAAHLLRIQDRIFVAHDDRVRKFSSPGAALRWLGQSPTPTPNCLRAHANHLHFCLNCDNIIDVIPRAKNNCESNTDHDFTLCDECLAKGYKTE